MTKLVLVTIFKQKNFFEILFQKFKCMFFYFEPNFIEKFFLNGKIIFKILVKRLFSHPPKQKSVFGNCSTDSLANSVLVTCCYSPDHYSAAGVCPANRFVHNCLTDIPVNSLCHLCNCVLSTNYRESIVFFYQP